MNIDSYIHKCRLQFSAGRAQALLGAEGSVRQRAPEESVVDALPRNASLLGIAGILNRSALEGKCGPAALGWPTVPLAGSYLGTSDSQALADLLARRIPADPCLIRLLARYLKWIGGTFHTV
jgi:hypothetical protein